MKIKLLGASAFIGMLLALSTCSSSCKAAVTQLGSYEAGVQRVQEMDNYFNVFPGITIGHHECHEGDCFVIRTNDASMSDTDFIELSLKTPAVAATEVKQKRVHITSTAKCESGAGNLNILEDVVGLAVGSGASLTPVNRNRGSSKVSSNTLTFVGATGAAITKSGGASIWQRHFGAGQGSSGSAMDTEEWVLKPGSSYVFTLTSEANTNPCELVMFWYEHTDDVLQ